MITIILSALALAALGFFCGWGLAYTYQKFASEENPLLAAVEAALPNANCGACGYPGCRAFAELVIAGKAKANGCLLGGIETGKAISKILGLDLEEKEPKAAFLLCGGGKSNAINKFEYKGVPSCKASQATGGGFKECKYGCLGFGDCLKICPVDAISMSENDLPIIDIKKCIACGKCLEECPRNLFVILKKNIKVHVNCASHDKGAATRKACKVGCIACSLCIKACCSGAITLNDNLAVIDQSKCTQGAECVAVCPTKTIIEIK